MSNFKKLIKSIDNQASGYPDAPSNRTTNKFKMLSSGSKLTKYVFIVGFAVVGIVSSVNIFALTNTVLSVSLISPIADAKIMGTLKPSARASGPSKLKQVQFYLDGTLVRTEKLAPYCFTGDKGGVCNDWDSQSVPDGVHKITAKVSDYAGSTAETSVSFSVSNALTVNLLAPRNGEVVKGSIKPLAVADGVNGVTKVDFFLDGKFVTTERLTPYCYAGDINSICNNWDSRNVTDGTHTILARAYNAKGETSEATATFRIANSFLVVFSVPIDGSTVKGSIKPLVNTSGSIGITKVDFYLDNILVHTENNAPYCYAGNTTSICNDWDTTKVSDGKHALRAKAYGVDSSVVEAISTITISNKVVDAIPSPTPPPVDTTPTPTTVSGNAVKPSAQTTGPRYSILRTMTADDAEAELGRTGYLSRVHISSGVLDLQSGWVIEDVVIDGGSLYGVRAFTGSGAGVPAVRPIIRYARVSGNGNSSACVYVKHTVIEYADVSSCIDLFKLGSGSTVRYSYGHDMFGIDGGHHDVVQTLSGTNILVEWNNFVGKVTLGNALGNPRNANSVLQIGKINGTLENVSWNDNWVDGGHYTLRGTTGDPGSYTVKNFVFHRNKHGRSYTYGPQVYMANPGTDNASWYYPDNVWEDTGLAVRP